MSFRDKIRTIAILTVRKTRDYLRDFQRLTAPDVPGGGWYNDQGSDSKPGILERHGLDFSRQKLGFNQVIPLRSVQQKDGVVTLKASSKDATKRAGWHTNRISSTGVDFSLDGKIRSEEHNHNFKGWKVLGRPGGSSRGLYHEVFVENGKYQRSWNNIKQSLITGKWRVDPPQLPDDASDYWRSAAQERADTIERAMIKQLEGGWSQYITNWLYCLIAGFSLFEEIYWGYQSAGEPGTIREFAFIYPSQVDGWIVNERGRLQGVYLKHTDGSEYTLNARNIQLYSHNRFGNNFAGISPERSIVRWHQVLTMAAHLEALSYERFGVPWITAQRKDAAGFTGGRNEKQAKSLRKILSAAKAEDSPVIRLPDGTMFEFHSPAGQMPDWDKLKRFCLEQIADVLKAEGSLIGVGDTGAYAARQVAEDERLQLGPYFAHRICQQVNGHGNTPYTGTVKKIEDARWGGPLFKDYCSLEYSAGQAEDPDWVGKVTDGVAQGVVQKNRNVVERMHERLDLEPPVWIGDDPLDVDNKAAQQQQQQQQQQSVDVAAATIIEQLDEYTPNGPEDIPLALGDFYDRVDGGDSPFEALMASMGARLDVANSCQHTDEERERIRAAITAAKEQDLDPGGRSIQAAEVDPDKANRELDQRQNQIAKGLKKVAAEHKREFRKLTSTEGLTSRQMETVRNTMRRKFIPKYEQVMREGLRKAYEKGAKRLVRDLGKVAPKTWKMPIIYQATDIIELQARQAAREGFQRQNGRMMEQQIRNRRGVNTVGLETLDKDRTWKQVANKGISAVYNRGRDAVAQRIKEAHERLGASNEVRATYSSVLDSDTCELCEDADGTTTIVGSNLYDEISPPNICKGRDRCRCYWIYRYSNEDALNSAFGAIGL